MSFPLSKVKDHYQHNYLNTRYVHSVIYDYSSRLDFEYSIKLTPSDLRIMYQYICYTVYVHKLITIIYFTYMLRYKSLSTCTLVKLY